MDTATFQPTTQLQNDHDQVHNNNHNKRDSIMTEDSIGEASHYFLKQEDSLRFGGVFIQQTPQQYHQRVLSSYGLSTASSSSSSSTFFLSDDFDDNPEEEEEERKQDADDEKKSNQEYYIDDDDDDDSHDSNELVVFDFHNKSRTREKKNEGDIMCFNLLQPFLKTTKWMTNNLFVSDRFQKPLEATTAPRK